MPGGQCPSPSCIRVFSTGKRKRRHVHKEGHGECVYCSQCNEPFLSERAREQHMAALNHRDFSASGLPTASPVSLSHMFQRMSIDPPKMQGRQVGSSDNVVYSIGSGAELNLFVANEIQPTSPFLDSNSSTINTLVHFLQNNVPPELRPARVIKGGSLGKGTAVNGASDIDLVFVLGRDVSDIETLIEKLPGLLSTLSRHLREYSEATEIKETQFAVQLQLAGHAGQSHSVDVLPAMNLDTSSASSLRQIYETMGRKSERERRFYSSSLSHLQLDIIRVLPTKVKSLIRLVKYWKKNIGEIQNLPTSFVMEIVVINAWTNKGSPSDFNMTGALRDVLTQLVDHRNFRVEFDRLKKYPTGMAPLGRVPYIIDPTNPYNDLYHGLFGKAWNWDALANEANRWLATSLFQGVSSTW